MPGLSKKNTTILIIVLTLAAVFGLKLYFDHSRSNVIVKAQPKVKGPKDAPIHITEYIDFECPACAHGAMFLHHFMMLSPDKIQLELKYFPLKMHRQSVLASRFAECASRQNKFWPYHDQLIERQREWAQMIDAQPVFVEIAKEVGMKADALKACIADPSVDQVISQNKDDGNKVGIKSTPTYFINGEMFVGPQALQKKLDELTSQ